MLYRRVTFDTQRPGKKDIGTTFGIHLVTLGIPYFLELREKIWKNLLK